MSSMITETIGSNYEGYFKWFGIVKGRDNCFYCLPSYAKQILKIDPSNDETTLVGEEYDGDEKWRNGFAHGDFIYGIPHESNQFLKYSIKTETSELVGDYFAGNYGKWMSGAVADDGCLYCFPHRHTRIVKFNPKDDTTIFVGEAIGGYLKFSGTIQGKNGCLYGIPSFASRVAKFNVATQCVTFIGDDYEDQFKWQGGVKGMDGNIYAVPYHHNKLLKVDTSTETTSLVGDDLSKHGGCQQNGGVVGEDCNIYTIPEGTEKVVTFNTTTQKVSEVGNRYGGCLKWSGGVLHSNGYIYCAPYNNNKVLKIKTNHIRDEGNILLESNASMTEFNRYINTNQFEYIYVTHKAFYDRLVSYRNNLIVETAKLALESFASSRASKDGLNAELSKMHDKLAESSASIVVLVSQSEATNSQLSSLEIALTENKEKLESEKLIRRQGELLAEARASDTEGVLEIFRSELDGLHEETKELRMELKVEKEKHKVEIEQKMTQSEEAKSMRTLGLPTAVTLRSSAVKKESVINDFFPSLNNRSRKRTR